MSVSVLVVDDHELVRRGFISLLDDMLGIDVHGQAADAQEALSLLAERPADIVLTDIGLPGLNGLELCERIVESCPRCSVIILSVHGDPAYVSRALKAGARGYLLKNASPEELELAIQSVHQGGRYLSPAVSDAVIDGFVDGSGTPVDPVDRLTQRQREILQLVAEGLTTKEIATRLDLSVKTVESHRSNIMERLDIHNLAGLVRFAIHHGLVVTDP